MDTNQINKLNEKNNNVRDFILAMDKNGYDMGDLSNFHKLTEKIERGVITPAEVFDSLKKHEALLANSNQMASDFKEYMAGVVDIIDSTISSDAKRPVQYDLDRYTYEVKKLGENLTEEEIARHLNIEIDKVREFQKLIKFKEMFDAIKTKMGFLKANSRLAELIAHREANGRAMEALRIKNETVELTEQEKAEYRKLTLEYYGPNKDAIDTARSYEERNKQKNQEFDVFDMKFLDSLTADIKNISLHVGGMDLVSANKIQLEQVFNDMRDYCNGFKQYAANKISFKNAMDSFGLRQLGSKTVTAQITPEAAPVTEKPPVPPVVKLPETQTQGKDFNSEKAAFDTNADGTSNNLKNDITREVDKKKDLTITEDELNRGSEASNLGTNSGGIPDVTPDTITNSGNNVGGQTANNNIPPANNHNPGSLITNRKDSYGMQDKYGEPGRAKRIIAGLCTASFITASTGGILYMAAHAALAGVTLPFLPIAIALTAAPVAIKLVQQIIKPKKKLGKLLKSIRNEFSRSYEGDFTEEEKAQVAEIVEDFDKIIPAEELAQEDIFSTEPTPEIIVPEMAPLEKPFPEGIVSEDLTPEEKALLEGEGEFTIEQILAEEKFRQEAEDQGKGMGGR